MIDISTEKYHYTINPNLEIKVWNIDENIITTPPFFYQPDHPDARPWESIEEAQAWIEYMISEWEKPPVVIEE